jgi:hypothetical protein
LKKRQKCFWEAKKNGTVSALSKTEDVKANTSNVDTKAVKSANEDARQKTTWCKSQNIEDRKKIIEDRKKSCRRKKNTKFKQRDS